MRGINHVVLLGHLGANPELRTTSNGKSVCELRVATNRSTRVGDEWRDATDWHTVTAWDRQAEYAHRTLSKGSLVGIVGSLRTDSWEDKTTGQRRYKTIIVAERIQAPGRSSTHEAAEQSGAARQHAPVQEEEIPF